MCNRCDRIRITTVMTYVFRANQKIKKKKGSLFPQTQF